MVAPKPIKVPAKWQKLFKLLPGYDPIATAAPGEWFDAKEADDAIDFFPTCLKHVKGRMAGKPYELEGHEKALVGCIFGWKRADGTRRYREVLYYVPRKNSKSTLAAGLVLRVLVGDGEQGAEIYSTAADRDQASLVYNVVRGMVVQDPDLMELCAIHQSYKTIEHHATSGVYRAISSEANTKHGYNTHMAVNDELHAHSSAELVNVIQTSTGARLQPLIVHITTADYDRPHSICNEKHAYASKVRDGIIKDSSFLPMIYEAKRDDDWKDPAVWAKANPMLGKSFQIDYLERECQRAIESPAYENTFKRLHLNMKTEQDMRVIPMASWDMGEETFTTEDLRGMKCFGGLDLASTEDLCSFGLVFPMENDECRVLSWSWCPEERVRKRGEKRDPFPLWRDEGWLTATTGNQTDYNVIREDICRFRDEYGFDILEISFDQWNAAQIVQDLMEHDGFSMVRTPQSLSQLSAPTKEFLRRVKAGKLKHQGNPLLRWAASNMAIHYSGKLQDDADLEGILDKVPVMPSKQKSADKIDPITAIVLGFKSMIAHPDDWGTSVYDRVGGMVL